MLFFIFKHIKTHSRTNCFKAGWFSSSATFFSWDLTRKHPINVHHCADDTPWYLYVKPEESNPLASSMSERHRNMDDRCKQVNVDLLVFTSVPWQTYFKMSQTDTNKLCEIVVVGFHKAIFLKLHPNKFCSCDWMQFSCFVILELVYFHSLLLMLSKNETENVSRIRTHTRALPLTSWTTLSLNARWQEIHIWRKEERWRVWGEGRRWRCSWCVITL